MKKLLCLIISVFLLPALSFATVVTAKKVQVSRIDCTFEEPFFKMSYSLSTKKLVIHDLTMNTKDVYQNIQIKKINSRQVQMQYSNGSALQTLTFIGKGTGGKSTQSSFFSAHWTAYNYGTAPTGECHTL